MKEKITIIILLLIIVLLIIYINLSNKEISDNIDIKRQISIDIKGAVKNPGIKKMDVNSNVSDLIEKSGGLLENADTSIINLSKKLEDEMVVIIYTIDEVEDMKKEQFIKIIDKECVCPVITNNACNNNFTSVLNESNNTNKISLNNASKEELMTLSGIGSSKADAIIEYRNNTPFNNIEELINVKGIGETIFNKIKDNITI